MAKAVFHKDFNYSSRVQNAGWGVQASEKPQSFPEELIAAAVAAGVATRVEKSASAVGASPPNRNKNTTK